MTVTTHIILTPAKKWNSPEDCFLIQELKSKLKKLEEYVTTTLN